MDDVQALGRRPPPCEQLRLGRLAEHEPAGARQKRAWLGAGESFGVSGLSCGELRPDQRRGHERGGEETRASHGDWRAPAPPRRRRRRPDAMRPSASSKHCHRRPVGAECCAGREVLVQQYERAGSPRRACVSASPDETTTSRGVTPFADALPGDQVLVHRATEAAVRVPEQQEGVSAAERRQRDRLAVERRQLERRCLRSDRQPGASTSCRRAPAPRACSIHSCPVATQLADRPVGGDRARRSACRSPRTTRTSRRSSSTRTCSSPCSSASARMSSARAVAREDDRQLVRVLALPPRGHR